MLDKNQLKAVEAKQSKVLVVAAPGAGKTTVILNRIDYLINNKKVFWGAIYVITFTKAAALSMKERYRRNFSDNKSPFFGTFHGLFYKILLRESYSINIIQSTISNRIIKEILVTYIEDVNEDTVKEILNSISKYKTNNGFYDEKSSISKEIFLKCYKTYEDYKKQKQLYDFDDLSIIVVELLEKNIVLREKYGKLFKYILVDEFQDCDELQIRFLRLMNNYNDLFAVGDEDQCIYSFRGSKPNYMVEFDKIFKYGIKLYLNRNYRSSNNIVELSKELIEKNSERNRKTIEADRKKKGKIKLIQPINENRQGDDICNIVMQSGYTLEETAILYRTNIESRGIIDSCLKNRIKFNILDKGYNFFEHFICKDILNYLTLSINIHDKEAFSKVINKPFRYISKDSIEYIKRTYSGKDPFDILIERRETKDYQCKKLQSIKDKVLSLNKYSLGSALQIILTELGYYEYLQEYCNRNNINIEDLDEVLEEFKNLIEDYKTIIQLLVHVDKVKESLDNKKINNDGVVLSTIHGVKGMEFKNVFIINVVEDLIPHKSSVDSNLKEERRLFYVAITRAIDNLYISVPKNLKSTNRVESRFLKESNLRKYVYEDFGIKVGSEIKHRNFGRGKVLELGNGNIEIEFENGENKRFSLDILINSKILELI